MSRLQPALQAWPETAWRPIPFGILSGYLQPSQMSTPSSPPELLQTCFPGEAPQVTHPLPYSHSHSCVFHHRLSCSFHWFSCWKTSFHLHLFIECSLPIHAIIYSTGKYFIPGTQPVLQILRAYSMPGTIFSVWDTWVNKTEALSWGVALLVGRDKKGK